MLGALALVLGCQAQLSGGGQGGPTLGSGGSGLGSPGGGGGSAGSAGGSSAPLDGPGRVVMHRLNVSEYNNTVRDLLQTEERLSDSFPPDEAAYGFDNIAAALSMTDVSLSYYIDAAKKLAAEALSSERRASLVTCDLASAQETCVTTIVQAFLARAWRRPAETADVTRLVALYTQNKADSATDDEALARVLQAILLAPEFLFRVEQNSGVAGPRPLNGYEIASRLSYFLWSSMPDDALFGAAAGNQLSDEAQIGQQVSRMLADPKAAEFTDRFGSQWLSLRSLENVHPDAAVYPAFDDALRSAMRDETMRFFADIVAGQRAMGELITTTSGYVNDRLAQHYGLPAVGSQTSLFTPLPVGRGGILTQASILTVLAHPKESAPVLRGKWILSQLLCQELPPPPPDVPQEPAAQAGQSRRERLEAHRIDPICKSCHQMMDPPGLALEQYDGIGAFRTTDNGVTIDPSGTLSDGTPFANAQELAQIVAGDARFPACVTRHLFTYGLGRAPRKDSTFDAAELETTSGSFVSASQNFPALVGALAASGAFRQREDEAAAP